MQKGITPTTVQPPQCIYKDNNNWGSQLYIIREAFEVAPATMLMIAHQTGIERANVCRHVATLRKTNSISLTGKRLCKISNYTAGYYTTDPSLMDSQLTLF